MKSITIHGIDEPLEKLIKSRAREEGLSINKTLKKLLEQSLGVKPNSMITGKILNSSAGYGKKKILPIILTAPRI